MTELMTTYERLKVGLPTITDVAFKDFSNLFSLSEISETVYGATFYKYFCLDRVSDQSLVSQIYPLGEEKAKKLISEIFKIKVS